MADDIAKPEPVKAAAPKAEPVPGSAGPVDIAMDSERHDRAADSPARMLLVKQARLVDLQIASERFSIAFKTLSGLAAALVLTALAFMIWEASRAEGLVIEAFSVPPEFAQSGLSGEVAASELQDRLSDIQAVTQSARAAESFSNDWTGDIEVQIPQTGVSLGELRRFLRQWLGRETRVSGAVVRTPEGLRLTARAEGRGADAITGPEGHFDRMLALAAERVMERTQPYRYAVYLRQQGRGAEAAAVVARLSENGPRSELPWALIGLSQETGDPDRAIAYLQQAIRLDPNITLSWINLAYLQDVLGLNEAELASRRHALRTVRRRDRGSVTETAATVIRPAEAARIATLLGDHERAARFQVEVETAPKFYGYGPTGSAIRAELLALNHDVSGARRTLAGRLDDGEVVAALIEYDVNLPNHHAAVALDDWPTALAQLRAAERAAAEHGVARHRNMATLTLAPLIAEALARTGRLEEAEAAAARTRLDCYPCLRVRGEIATLKRNWPTAERWFAEAARQGPSLPFAYSEWGQAKAARGDLDGAIRLFQEAQKRGPRWADPLKFEGDALARRGDHRAAVRRYREAMERAPRWGALHLAWGRSLAALGLEEQARAKYARAAGLDLSAADRALVQQWLARRRSAQPLER